MKKQIGLFSSKAEQVSEKGFTLIELLTSVIVSIVIGSVIVGIIFSTLRGANKTDVIENIDQNGNHVLDQMSKDIRYALPFDGKNTGLSNSANPATYDKNCIFSLNPTPTPVTPYNFITVESANNIITQYECSGSTPSDSVLSKNGNPLLDLVSVSLQNCSLQCIQNKPTDTPIVRISFALAPLGIATNLPENLNSPITFRTSIVMENYQR